MLRRERRFPHVNIHQDGAAEVGKPALKLSNGASVEKPALQHTDYSIRRLILFPILLYNWRGYSLLY